MWDNDVIMQNVLNGILPLIGYRINETSMYAINCIYIIINCQCILDISTFSVAKIIFCQLSVILCYNLHNMYDWCNIDHDASSTTRSCVMMFRTSTNTTDA